MRRITRSCLLSMSSFPRPSFLSLAVAALALLAVAGCSDQVYYTAPREDEIPSPIYVGMANVPPPVNSDEIHAVPDPRTQVWRPGHWSYENRQFLWVPGEMMQRPSATAVWSPDQWQRRMYGWVFIPGYWQ